MNRRRFYKSMGLLGLFPLFPSSLSAKETPTRILPPRLKKGDTIALITPASALPDGALDECIQKIKSFGLQPITGPNVGKKWGFLAGHDKERIADIHWAFSHKKANGIWCLRGGYGVGRILPKLDYQLIRKNPKLLIGYSDITALHHALWMKAGLVSFHGPVATSDMTPYTRTHAEKALFQSLEDVTLQPSQDHAATCKTLHGGSAVGRLAGGNLSLLASLCGTPYLPSFRGKIVFIEDIGESPYRIDRMITQLKQAADLERAAGIVLGQFSDWKEDDFTEEDIDLHELFDLQFSSLNIPIIQGFSLGHIADQITLPSGTYAKIDADHTSITLLEAATRQ